MNSIVVSRHHADLIIETLGECYQSAPDHLRRDIEEILKSVFFLNPKEAYEQSCLRFLSQMAEQRKLRTPQITLTD